MTIGLKILALGTSLTATPLWPDQLKVQMENCLQQPVEVQVIARRGMTSRWGLEQTERVVLAKPDLLFIEFAANDADLRRWLFLPESKQNHIKLIQAARAANPHIKIILWAVNPTWGIRSWIRPRLNAYYGLYPGLAQEQPDVSFVDVRPKWDWKQIGETVPDGLHPTPQAMIAIAGPNLAEPACKQLNSQGQK